MTGMTATRWLNRIVGHAAVPPADLVPNPRNWRSHPSDQQQALSGALAEVGWVAEVLVNRTTGHVVDGYLRIELALDRKEPSVPVTYVELSEDEERLVLATLEAVGHDGRGGARPARRSPRRAGAGRRGLRALLDDLGRDAGIESIRAGLVDPDDVPEIPDEPTVQRGELYRLGDHRLLCGDATDTADVERLRGGEAVDCLWTDPPYGVEYQMHMPTVAEAAARHRRKDGLTIANDTANATRALLISALRLTPLRTGGAFYVASPSGDIESRLPSSAGRSRYSRSTSSSCGSRTSSSWAGGLPWRHETVLYGWAGEPPTSSAEAGARTRSGDPAPEAVRSPPDHEARRTRRPCLGELLATRRDRHDPFTGSGTTLIAAEQAGRRGFGMELDPRYAQVAVERWEAFTGGQRSESMAELRLLHRLSLRGRSRQAPPRQSHQVANSVNDRSRVEADPSPPC